MIGKRTIELFKHDGIHCPVPLGTRCLVERRSGDKHIIVTTETVPRLDCWIHDGGDMDIMFYRVLREMQLVQQAQAAREQCAADVLDALATRKCGGIGCRQLDSDRDAALEEIKRLRKDAERYRYLRDEDHWGEDSGDDTWEVLGEVSGEWFDQVVDSRMAKALTE